MQKKSDLFNNHEFDYRQNWMTSFVSNKTIITETKFEIKQQQDTVKISQEYFYRHHNIDIINVDMRI